MPAFPGDIACTGLPPASIARPVADLGVTFLLLRGERPKMCFFLGMEGFSFFLVAETGMVILLDGIEVLARLLNAFVPLQILLVHIRCRPFVVQRLQSLPWLLHLAGRVAVAAA